MEEVGGGRWKDRVKGRNLRRMTFCCLEGEGLDGG